MIQTPPARVLIVCTANAIRSPFLEHLLRARLERSGVVVPVIESAGSAARPDQSAEPRVVEIGRGHGLDIGPHRTRHLEESMLAPGVTVLCAAAMHRRAVLDMRPELLDTTFTAREFARLLGDEREPVGAPGDWAALVRAASRQRSRARRGTSGEDDLVDPIGQPAPVWEEFERNAVEAVESIARHAERLLRSDAAAPQSETPPRTRRELRAWRARIDAGSPVQ